MPEAEIPNRFGVTGRTGDNCVAILRPPLKWMSPDDALLLAAWLVARTGAGDRFMEVLTEVLRRVASEPDCGIGPVTPI